MTALSPSAIRRAARAAARDRRPEERPCYLQRKIARVVEVRMPLPPPTNTLFANVAGRGRIKTPRYRMWRQQAVLAISLTRPIPCRIAGPCDVDLYLPPFRGDTDNRVKPALDAAVQAGILADDGDGFVPHVRAHREAEASDLRLVCTAIPVEPDDAAEIEVRAREGQPLKLIAAALGLSLGQVETVLAEARAR